MQSPNPDMIARDVRAFIVDQFLPGEPEDHLRDDDLLLEGGMIDSGSVITLVAFLEDRFGIRIRDEDLFPENFATVARIAAFIAKQLDDSEDHRASPPH